MVSFKGGGGTSQEEAIIIEGTEDTAEGVGAEYYYIDRLKDVTGQEIKLLRQSLLHDGDKSYDIMELEFEDGTTTELWFDITGFYGKFNL